MPSIGRRLFQIGLNRLFFYLFTRHYPRRPPPVLRDFGESSKVGRADDTDPCGLRMASFVRVPFLLIQCWSEDRFVLCPLIHVRATKRLPNDPRRFVEGSWRRCGEERAETHVCLSTKGIWFARFSHVEPGYIELRRGLADGGER